MQRAKKMRMTCASFNRLGIVLSPNGDEAECDGTINPASARTRDGTLVLFPRFVAGGNVSRIARCTASWNGDEVTFERDGFVLEPDAPYEIRTESGGYGCEDPRVTYVSALDRYLMAYCANGPAGARIAIAISDDARKWTRLGLVDFHGKEGYGDKDAAFFPDIVQSPSGVRSFALLHRPTLHASTARGREIVPEILALPPSERESICIAYVPAEAVVHDIRALLDVRETHVVLQPDGAWGTIKVGTGTPPVRAGAAWLLVYHGIDVMPGHEASERPAMQYRAGLALLDLTCPHAVIYRSAVPLFSPELPEECNGLVDNVVFPTAIDARPDLGKNVFDIYYGMGDDAVGRGRLEVFP